MAADPTDGYGQRNLAALLIKAGRNTEALAHLRVARQVLPHDAQTLFGLAAALESVGGEDNVDEADELYQVAKNPSGLQVKHRAIVTTAGLEALRAMLSVQLD